MIVTLKDGSKRRCSTIYFDDLVEYGVLTLDDMLAIGVASVEYIEDDDEEEWKGEGA